VTGCRKIRGQLCACFIGSVSEFEATLISKTLDIIYAGVDQSQANNITIARDRDLQSLAAFILKYSELIKKDIESPPS
jgi:hypothetical protein